MMTRNRYGSIDLVNLLITVGHIEGHRREVRISVGKLTFIKTHVCLTIFISTFHHVSTCSVSCTAESEVCSLIQRSTVSGIETAHTVFNTIVIRSVIVTDNRHCSIDLVNLLITIRHIEGHISEVRICIGELTSIETHVGGTCISSLSRRVVGITIEGKVGNCVQRSTDGYIIAANAVFCTIVIRSVMMTFDGYYHRTHRVDFLITLGHVEGHCRKVGVRVGELTLEEVHIGSSNFRSLSGRVSSATTEAKVRSGVQRVADSHIVAAHTMFIIIKCHGAMMTCNGNRHIDRGNLLITIGYIEGHCLKVRVIVGELIFGKTHISLTIGISTFHHIGTGSGIATTEAEVDVATAHLI